MTAVGTFLLGSGFGLAVSGLATGTDWLSWPAVLVSVTGFLLQRADA